MKFNVRIARNNPLVGRDIYDFQVDLRAVYIESFVHTYTGVVCVFRKDYNYMQYDSRIFYQFAKDAEAVTNCDGGYIRCSDFVMEKEDYEYFKDELSDYEGCIYDTSWESINKAFHKATEKFKEPRESESTSDFLNRIYKIYIEDTFLMADNVDCEEIEGYFD